MPAALILMNPSRPGQKIPANTVVLGSEVKAAIGRASSRRNPGMPVSAGTVTSPAALVAMVMAANPGMSRAHAEAFVAQQLMQQGMNKPSKRGKSRRLPAGLTYDETEAAMSKLGVRSPRRNPMESAKHAAEKAQARVALAIERMREAKAGAAAAKQRVKEARANPSKQYRKSVGEGFRHHGPVVSRASAFSGDNVVYTKMYEALARASTVQDVIQAARSFFKTDFSNANTSLRGQLMNEVERKFGPDAKKTLNAALTARKNPQRGKDKYMAKVSKRGLRANPRGMRAARKNPAGFEKVVGMLMARGASREEAERDAIAAGIKKPAPRVSRYTPAATQEEREERARARKAQASARLQRMVSEGKYASIEAAQEALRMASRQSSAERRADENAAKAKFDAGETLSPAEDKAFARWMKRSSRSKEQRHKQLLALWPIGQYPATYAAREFANDHPDPWDAAGNVARLHVRQQAIMRGDNDASAEEAIGTGRFAGQTPKTKRYRYDQAARTRAAANYKWQSSPDETGGVISGLLGFSDQPTGSGSDWPRKNPRRSRRMGGLRNNPYSPEMDLKSALPAVAMGMGATIAVWAATAKVSAMAKGSVQNEMLKKVITPAVALGIGVGGFMLMKKSEALKKYSGLALCGGMATAVAAIMATKLSDGKSIEDSYGIALGDYHVGDYHVGAPTSINVGDYHVGAPTSINVGDYHVGEVVQVAPGIDAITDRRIPASPGEPMERHETRRDYPQKLDAFGGTLAGDIFDQG